jgi:DNA-binding transcriptional MerR regulator
LQLERRLIARLKTADIRFTDAQIERIWAIVSAHEAGLSIRKIASATGLSSSRIHQLLNAPEAKEIPVWLSQLQQSSGGSGRKEKAHRPEPETEIRSRLAREVQVLRLCTEWLQRLECGESVVVNLRPDADVDTEFVAFDRPRVVRVLERIAADLDNLSMVPNDAHADKESNHDDPRERHRHELAELSREPKKLSHREQRTALRAALGLPPQ